MAILGKEALRSVVKYTEVDVPEMGGAFRLRTLSSAKVMELTERFGLDANKKPSELLHIAAHLLVDCWVDEEGEQVLSQDDVDGIFDMPLAALNRLADAIFELNGLNESAAHAAKKTLSTNHNGASGSN